MLHYIKETKAELRHVSWPTQKQAIAYTAITVIVSLLASVYLGLFDQIFLKLLDIVLLA